MSSPVVSQSTWSASCRRTVRGVRSSSFPPQMVGVHREGQRGVRRRRSSCSCRRRHPVSVFFLPRSPPLPAGASRSLRRGRCVGVDDEGCGLRWGGAAGVELRERKWGPDLEGADASRVTPGAGRQGTRRRGPSVWPPRGLSPGESARRAKGRRHHVSVGHRRMMGSTKIRGVKRRDRPACERCAGVRGRRLDVQRSMSATLTPRILGLPARDGDMALGALTVEQAGGLPTGDAGPGAGPNREPNQHPRGTRRRR